ncbi:MAG: hypothetical protein O7E51_06915 [Acidobacteria bacterium]|nr:hypothetical protein [Acidobacteriota bacterium]
MSEELELIRNLEIEIRDFITEDWIRHSLAQDLASWNVLLSSLDVIGDTTLAIGAYEQLSGENNSGLLYLYHYGILQILFVQQDATENILKSLSINVPEADKDWRYVSDIRNRAVGHPTRTDRRKKGNVPQASHHISRMSLYKGGFKLLSVSGFGKNEFVDVSVLELIAKQKLGVVRLLQMAVETLRKREMEHRRKFRDKPLSAIILQTTSHAIEKLFEGCHRSNEDRAFAALNADYLLEIIGKFEAAFIERDILPVNHAIDEQIQEVKYPIEELKKFFDGTAASTLNEKSSYIFAFFVRAKMADLASLAKEIDDKFAADIQSG